MIYVSQGHEHSISLEIFFKSFLMLSQKEREQFVLVVEKNVFDYQVKCLKIGSVLKDLQCIFIDNQPPLSTLSLEKCLKEICSSDVLITLPTSKEQLIFESKTVAGHTDFFRKYFKKNSITMTFMGGNNLMVLITDHIPLHAVPGQITEELIYNKVQIVLQEWKRYFSPVREVLFAGINPHAGESGLLGKEDIKITNVIKKLNESFSIKFSGPFSADGLSLKKKEDNSMMVFMYHDQGLSWFKERYGFMGLNITLGLPFLRFSVDHGTAFDLYGKNQAYYLGCFYLLKESLKAQRKIKWVLMRLP